MTMNDIRQSIPTGAVSSRDKLERLAKLSIRSVPNATQFRAKGKHLTEQIWADTAHIVHSAIAIALLCCLCAGCNSVFGPPPTETIIYVHPYNGEPVGPNGEKVDPQWE